MKRSSVTDDDETANQGERRALRKEYRELKDLVDNDSNALAAIPSQEYSNCHNTINDLFGQVSNVRELGREMWSYFNINKNIVHVLLFF